MGGGGWVCWLQARGVTDQSRVCFAHVLCRVQHNHFEQGPLTLFRAGGGGGAQCAPARDELSKISQERLELQS